MSGHTDKETLKGVAGETESPEQELCFDDIISPGGGHFTFGSFQNVEIKNLWKIDTGDNSSTVINEYGTNMVKSKSDPLVAVEAKQALLSGQHSPLKTVQEELQPRVSSQEEQMAEAEDESSGKVSIPSPYISTQETVELASQDYSSQEPCLEETQPIKVGQKQSDRLKTQGQDNRTIAEKAEDLLSKKNLEGNLLSSKNSFAVLENSDILIKAGKLGLDSEGLNYEKIDVLKELERARAGLIEKKGKGTEVMGIEDETSLPFEEMKFLEWHEEDTDEEGFHTVSHKKSKKKRKSLVAKPRKKVERRVPPPSEGDNSLNEGISKICSGYNLREKRIPRYKLSS